jgi:hypothetical protein
MATSVLEIGQTMFTQCGTEYPPSSILQTKSTDHTIDPLEAGLRKRHSRSHCSKNIAKPVSTRRWSPVVLKDSRHRVPSSKPSRCPPQRLVEYDLFSQQTTAGRIEVQYKKQCLLKHHECSGDSDTEEPSAEEKFSARMVIVPASGTDLRSKVILNVSQQSTSTSSILSTPILSFRSIIPANSKIFDIVRYDTLRDLQKALCEGSASVTDCDPDGRSLLNVSINS